MFRLRLVLKCMLVEQYLLSADADAGAVQGVKFKMVKRNKNDELF